MILNENAGAIPLENESLFKYFYWNNLITYGEKESQLLPNTMHNN